MSDGTIRIIDDDEYDYVPDNFLTDSLEDIVEYLDKRYGAIEREREERQKKYLEDQERKQYELLKAKFEKQ
jgi:hypothetical protein